VIVRYKVQILCQWNTIRLIASLEIGQTRRIIGEPLRPAESCVLGRSAGEAYVRMLQTRRERDDAYRDKNCGNQL
jgi:hypothetical protein